MINLIFESVHAELPVLSGVHFFLFQLKTDDLNKDGASFVYNGESIPLDIESDDKLLEILKLILTKQANTGAILDIHIFFYGNRIGLLPQISKVSDKAFDTIQQVLANYRQAGVILPKKGRKKNAKNTNKMENV